MTRSRVLTVWFMALAAVACSGTPTNPHDTARALGIASPPPTASVKAATHWPATLDYVVDGDTQRFYVDLGRSDLVDQCIGFHICVINHRMLLTEYVRDEGINAAEHATPGGDAATAWGEAWFAIHPGPYTLTTHHTAGSSFDTYDRFIGSIRAPNGDDYATDMLHAGYAEPYNGSGTKPLAPYPAVPNPTASPLYR